MSDNFCNILLLEFGAAEHPAADVELESWQLRGHILGNYILYVTRSDICCYHVTIQQ